MIEAETATIHGDASVIAADPVNTGVAQWSGGSYVQVGSGSRLTWTLDASTQDRIIEPIVDRVTGPAGRTRFTAGCSGRAYPVGFVAYGNAGPQGQSPAPTTLLPLELARTFPAGATTLSATTSGGVGRLDALLITPVISQLSLMGSGRSTVLLSSRSGHREVRKILMPGSATTTVSSYDSAGRLLKTTSSQRRAVSALVVSAGFTVITG